MELILTLLTGNQSGHMSRVRGERLVVGRATGSKIRIPSSQISRSHALITWQKVEGGYYMIEDMGSTNGTFINQIAVLNPVALLPGDDLNLGSLSFRVHYRMEPKVLKRLSGLRKDSGYPAPGAPQRAAVAGSTTEEIPLAAILDEVPMTEPHSIPAGGGGLNLFDDAPIPLADVSGSDHLELFEEPQPSPASALDLPPIPLSGEGDPPLTDFEGDLNDFDLDDLNQGMLPRDIHLAELAKMLGDSEPPRPAGKKPPPPPPKK
jgi:predicted component of type VI protein secretion system